MKYILEYSNFLNEKLPEKSNITPNKLLKYEYTAKQCCDIEDVENAIISHNYIKDVLGYNSKLLDKRIIDLKYKKMQLQNKKVNG